MRIVFLMEHPGYVRHYASVIRMLSDRGNQVVVGFVVDSLSQAEKRVDIESARALIGDESVLLQAAPQRRGMWRAIARVMRLYADYLRYFHPDFADASKLRARARRSVFLPLRAYAEMLHRREGYPRVEPLLRRVLALESVYPSDPAVTAYMSEVDADAVVVTPLVEFGSWLTDYVTEARRRGVPSAVAVASWDNLTNKGLMRTLPDRVVLWNESQRTEATKYHGVDTTAVVVTGAQTFDPWFDMSPSVSAAGFRQRVGIKDDGAIILYLCSSSFICSVEDEAAFLRSWIAALRHRDEVQLREANVLIRPHPLDGSRWHDKLLPCDSRVVVWPAEGVVPLSETARRDFYDSLYHCSAVVGVNTSALIEAGILGRSVHTYLAPEFRGTQQGTLHFRHLESGGLLSVSNHLDAHFSGLADAIEGNGPDPNAREFIRQFVRPHGIGLQAGPFVADAVESLAQIDCVAAPRNRTDRGTAMLLSPVALLFSLLYSLRSLAKGARV